MSEEILKLVNGEVLLNLSSGMESVSGGITSGRASTTRMR